MEQKKAVCGGFYIGDGLEMDGKVLSATGGSSNIFVVTAVWDDNIGEYGDYAIDKSYDEVLEAINSYKIVIFNYDKELYLYDRINGEDIVFYKIDYDNAFGNDYIDRVPFKKDGTLGYSEIRKIEPRREVIQLYTTGAGVWKFKDGTMNPKKVFEKLYGVAKNPYVEFCSTGSDGGVQAMMSLTLEKSHQDLLVLSYREVNADGNIEITILTANGETATSFTKTTKTIT